MFETGIYKANSEHVSFIIVAEDLVHILLEYKLKHVSICTCTCAYPYHIKRGFKI